MTNRKLHTFADFLEAVRRILVNGIWIAIILVILGGVGWFLVGSQLGSENNGSTTAKITEKPVQPSVNWQKVDSELAVTLQKARENAREYAAQEIDKWIVSMMERVDNSFLDWYFNYWTQQVLGLKGLYQYGVHYVLENQPTASEKLTEEIQAEFTARVLQPQIAQKVLERVIHETAVRYIDELRSELDRIPQTYGISRARWQSYLEDIAITTRAVEGSRETPLTLKAVTVSGGGGAILLAANIKTMLGKVSAKIMAKSSGKLASKMAAKTGGKVVAKVGGKFFGTIAGFGVLVWDIWDHSITEQNNRPQLRQSLVAYFDELKLLLLDDPEFGIMTTFAAFERGVVEQGKKQNIR